MGACSPAWAEARSVPPALMGEGAMLSKLHRAVLRAYYESRTIDITDSYIEWLKYVTAGVLVRGNLYSMDHAIRNLPDHGSVIEIGTLCGLSTNAMSYYMRKHRRKNQLFTCDAWTYERFIDEEAICEVPIEEYQQFVKSTYIRNAQMFSRQALPSTVQMLSDPFFAAWEENRTVTDVFGRQVMLGGPIGFAYIDGDHSYEQSRQDFLNCDRYLLRGGFVLFDDSADYSEWGARRTAQEAMHRKDYELVIKNPNYLLRKVA